MISVLGSLFQAHYTHKTTQVPGFPLPLVQLRPVLWTGKRGHSHQRSPGWQPQSPFVAAPQAQADTGCQTPRYPVSPEGQLFSLFIAV